MGVFIDFDQTGSAAAQWWIMPSSSLAMEHTLERTIAWLRTRGVLFGEWKGDVKEQEQPVWNRYLRQLPTRFRNLRFGFIDELLQF